MFDAGMRSKFRANATVAVAVFFLLPEWSAAGDVPIVPCSVQRQSPAASQAEQLLRQPGVMPDAPGLRRYLAAIEPSEAVRAEVQRLVKQLGHRSYGRRIHATRALYTELSRQPHLTRVELTKALANDDAEVRHRAAALLLRVDRAAQHLLLAAMQVIKHREIKGLAAEVLTALPYCDNEHLKDAAQQAMLVTVRRDDQPMLRALATHSETNDARLIAILALERAGGAAAQADLVPLLSDANESVRLAAAQALVNYRPHEVLAVVATLLESEDQAVRGSAATLLRTLTGQQFGFTSFDAEAHRAESVKSWKQWIANHADAAPLRIPMAPLAQRKERALVCTFNPFRVKEVGLHGENLFDSDIADSACGAVRLPSGRKVFADWGSKSLIFLDASGRREYAVDLPGTPNGLDLLDNGNLLVPLFHEKSLVEISPSGQTVWQIELEGRPTDARRLENGGTLVALNSNDRIIEINREGEIVWSIDDVRSPESARRLKNGNTLVAMRLGVKEYNPAGEEVWSLEDLSSPYDAVLLDNGNLLIGHAGGLREVNREGQLIREFPLGTVRRIFYY